MKAVKVGVVGCGQIAKEAHIPNYVMNPKAMLTAICDVDEQAAKALCEKYGVKHFFTNYEELFESNYVQAVSVCVPTHLHSKVVKAAAEHGIHVLCEKPIASTLKEADEILDAVSKSKIKFTVGYNRRFLPNHILMKKYLEEGRIGKPILARASTITMGPYQPQIEVSKYADEAKKRVGCLFDSGAHLVDLMLWLFGKPKEVNSIMSTYFEGVTVDDSAIMVTKFENGVIGSVHVAWLDLPNFKATENTRRIEIIGTHGLLESDCLGPSLSIYNKTSLTSKIKGKAWLTPVKFDPRIPQEALAFSFAKEIENFLDSIIKNKTPLVTGTQARESLRLILAAYESYESKKTVSLVDEK
jgi:predicted dehydrogenase